MVRIQNIFNKDSLGRYNLSLPRFQLSDSKKCNGKRFKDKVIIITGASSGIGKACAIEFAKSGAIVVLAARNSGNLKQVEYEINHSGGMAFSVPTDVSKIDDCKRLINSAVKEYGKIDILINNAGISMRAAFDDIDLNVMRELMDTNFYGTVYCTKFALPYLQKQKGTVIGISSISGLAPLPGRTAYTASKHAMDGFLNSLRQENRRRGLNVLVVHPGFTESNIRNAALNSEGKPQEKSPRNEGKMMTSEKVAQHICKAIRKRNRDLVLTPEGRMVVWLHKNFPDIADRIILNEMSKEKNSPI
ncbi:MAG: SDR family oxidoreductase [Bacteroidales bacterium]|nr:SDR family oxidoreductase [Bacteroidales bacterium]